MFTRIPTSFLPDEDQGGIFTQVQTPHNSSAETTQKVLDRMTQFLLDKEHGEGRAVSSLGRPVWGVRFGSIAAAHEWPLTTHSCR